MRRTLINEVEIFTPKAYLMVSEIIDSFAQDLITASLVDEGVPKVKDQ